MRIPTSGRTSRRAAALVGAAALLGLGIGVAGLAAPAQAAPVPAAATTSHHYGVKPISSGAGYNVIAEKFTGKAANTLSLQTTDKPGAVSPHPKVYLVFWGKQWSSDSAKVEPDLQAMFKGLYGSADTWGTIMSQYCEGLAKGTTNCGSSGTHIVHPSASPLAGVYLDNAANAPTNATQAQIAAEAKKAAGHFGHTTQAGNINTQYVIVSAHGTHPDGFPNSGFCAWHDFTATSYGNLAYTNLPYIPDLGNGACTTLTNGRLLNGIESTETHEYAETVTDYWPTDGWYNSSGGEIGDECQNLDASVKLTTGTFDLQGLWSNSANACRTKN